MITKAIGIDSPKYAAPANERMIKISCVAYATDERASEAKTASPIVLLIV